MATMIESARSEVEAAIRSTVNTPRLPQLADMPKAQRRIWQAALAERAAEASMQERLRRALELGYDPISVPTLKERPSHGTPYETAWPSGMAVHEHSWWDHQDDFTKSTMVGIGSFLGMAALTFGGAALGLVHPAAMMLSFPAIFAGIPWLRRDRRAPDDCTWYNAPIPERPLRAYQKAKASGIFDDLRIYSQDSDSFRTRRRPTFGGDPLLIGCIGRHLFLIAAWDLGKDIAFADGIKAAAR